MSGEDILAYAELLAASNFSFLRGVSHPADMVAQAAALGLAGMGIADRNSVAGVVRAHVAWKELREAGLARDFRLLVGARLVFSDGTSDIAAYPVSRRGWGRLTSLLTRGNLRAKKGGCILGLADLAAHAEDLQLIVLEASSADGQEAQRKPVAYCPPLPLEEAGIPAGGDALEQALARLAARVPGRVWLGTAMLRRGDDARRLERMAQLARMHDVPLIALNDALYAAPEDRPLHDVVTAIRLGTTVQAAGRQLLSNAERHLKPPEEMARLFAARPEAIAETGRFMSGIAFTLDDLRYEYPHEPVPYGWKPQEWLEHMVIEAAHKRYGAELPDKVKRLLEEEFSLIRTENYACYFLTVHDVVRYARKEGILCQGRGSAANSIVCFLLGVTSVDPMQHNLLFSRFMSSERKEPPDIDVDFEHERREEVMQYIYRRYGRHRAGIAATVIHYRPRSTVREVGKALGIGEDVTARMASTVWGSYSSEYSRERVKECGFDPDNPEIARLADFVQRLLNFPRHLSQHVGGFVLTQDRLDEMVPLHNGAMEGRTFIEWDKDDIDALGLMKVDVLALGMLTCIAKGFELMRLHDLGDHNLEVDIECEDRAVYDMLCKGDSIGVFQVESRAQINMLPRLKPREFYDLVVQVAIVRPGPIEGDMVHPYLRRRSGEEAAEFPSPSPPHDPNELRDVLGKTFGVPIFQEQAMNLAITAANFTSEEANGLRRAMATFRNLGTIDRFRGKLVGGMVARGYTQDFAERCFRQIEGFGSYGFPESHAQSFARLVYVSAWMKCHHPAVFTCALLNSQPMGFYAPAQLVRDLIEHGGEVRPVDANASTWDSTLERREDGVLALRLGLRQVTGFRQDWAEAIGAARRDKGAFTSIEQLARAAYLPQRALRLLGDADALTSLGFDRRAALWEVRRIQDGELPLFAASHARELAPEPCVTLPPMTLGEHVASDYQLTRLSLKAHPMALLRHVFDADSVTPCGQLHHMKGGERVKIAGAVLIRQRPGKGTAIFITLEDESGIANIVLWASQLDRFRRAVMASRLMQVEGEVQRSREGVIHVMASHIADRSEVLELLSETHQAEIQLSRADEFAHPQHPRYKREGAPPNARHPRNVRLLPPSRDFR